MNKKEFLNRLEKKLSILDEQETKDITSEYNDIIEEKVKDGKTEEEAVNEFGNIDELAAEILKAYKINPKYSSNNDKDSLKEASQNFEGWIKKTANTLADTSKDMYNNFKKNNNDLSVEMIFELVIKFIIMLLILAVLRIPFYIIGGLGDSILDIAVFPMDNVLIALWRVFSGILYFGVCILVFVAMFKEYVNKDRKSINNPQPKQSKHNSNANKEKFNRVNENDSEPVKVEEHRNNNSNVNNGINSVLSALFKVFMIITFLIPLWCSLLGIVSALAVTLYYSIIGINIWGLVLIFLGISIGIGWAIDVFTQLTFKVKKIHFLQVFIGIVVVIIGGLLFVNNLFSFDYIDKKPASDFNYKTASKEFTLVNEAKIEVQSSYIDKEYKIDDTLEDNKVIIEFTYNADLSKLNSFDLEYNLILNGESRYTLNYILSDGATFNDAKDVYNLVIDNLKDGKFYDYDKLNEPSVMIIANTKTMEIVK